MKQKKQKQNNNLLHIIFRVGVSGDTAPTYYITEVI